MDGLDDIFKSFVSSKLKQLGINGVQNAEERLEETLKKSLTDGNKVMQETKEVCPSEDKVKDKKQKHKKKKKKHKEEKKKSHKDKENADGSRKRKLEQNEKKVEKDKPEQPLKKLLILETEEVEIKDKTLNCYHDTVTKIKEIEQLTLQVEPEDGEDIAPEKTKDPIFSCATDESQSSAKNLKPQTESPVADNKPSTTSLEKSTTVDNTKVSSLPIASSPVESTLTSTLKEIKSLTEMSARAIAKDTTEAQTAKKEEPENVPESQNSTEKSHKKADRPHRKHSSRRRSRSRSSSRSRKRSHKSKRHRSRSRSKSRHRHHHHHHSRSGDHHRRHKHHRKRSLSPVITKEDKVKLLAIAKANVMAQHRADVTISNLSHESKALIRSGGFTVEQLTDVCKDIVEGKREVDKVQSQPQTAPPAPAPIHHPFQVKTAPPISFNIKSTPVPKSNKPITELTKEFPVSSGSQHQHEEVYGKWEPVVKEDKQEKTTTEVSTPPVEEASNAVLIQNVIAERVHAVRELQTNPSNETAKKQIAESQEKLNSWTNALKMPGRFTGSSSLQPLSRSELEKGQAAWANSHTFNSCKQVEGIGKSLLEKMGWRAGESLGKTNVGLLEPLKVSVKTDRKGLSSFMEAPAVPAAPQIQKTAVKDLSGKHPVSALMELCTKRRWPAPEFRLVMDTGPDHSRSFLFKVTINNTAYQPAQAAMNKKIAKAQAAEAALKAMGLIQI